MINQVIGLLKQVLCMIDNESLIERGRVLMDVGFLKSSNKRIVKDEERKGRSSI